MTLGVSAAGGFSSRPLRVRAPWNLVTAALFVFIATLAFVHVPAAAASCSSTQGDVNIVDFPSSSSEGTNVVGETLPFIPFLCGSGWSNGGYVHGSVGQYFSATCDIDTNDWIEAGIFYGTNGNGVSSGSHLEYFYNILTTNVLDLCSGPTLYAASTTTYPSAGDNVSIDLDAETGTSSNLYTVQYHDYNTGVYLTISGISTGGRSGPDNIAELEIWNPINTAVVYWGTLEYVYGGNSYSIGHFSSSPTTSITGSATTNYNLVQPNTYFDDWCAYYTGNLHYC
jgi:hypothetical protein